MNPGSDDVRETLYNDRQIGPATQIALPLERITRLHGILFDFDPQLLVPENVLFAPAADPDQFFKNIQPVLDRHPLVQHAEVRASGSGLHALLWFEPPVDLTTAVAQQRWRTLVEAVQTSLPVDPAAPGLTALTRPLAARNSKTGATVRQLRAGRPVLPEAVSAYVAQLAQAPFREVAQVLLGETRVTPCPVCRGPNTRLDLLDRGGRCYGGCGDVDLGLLYECVLQSAPADPPAAKKKQTGKPTAKSGRTRRPTRVVQSRWRERTTG